MFGDFVDPRVAAAVGSIFGGASEQMRERAARSAMRELEGQLPASETSATDWLVDDFDRFGGALHQSLESAQEELRGLGVDLKIDFDACKPQGENEHGADIGIRIQIESAGFCATKGCLVQCKRMYGPSTAPTFKEVRGRGEKQARDMLKITPASMFMLYSFLPQDELLALAGLPLSVLCPRYPLPTAIRHRDALDQCAVWRDVGPGWDLGIALIPANRVLALSAAAAIQRRPMTVAGADVLRGAWPFGAFVTDLLGSCMVGDPRADVVKVVTPPGRWNAETAHTGLPVTDEFDGFAVRYVLDVTLRSLELQTQRR